MLFRSGLAVFNGVNDTRAGLVRRILATDSVCGTPLSHARHSGYIRLQQGNSTIMVDVGKPTMPAINVQATASALAFEFSDGGTRLITNCGAIQHGDEAWSAAARSTQAHSTLCIDDQPVGGILDGVLTRLACGGPVVLSAPNISAELETGRQGAKFIGSQDGYKKRTASLITGNYSLMQMVWTFAAMTVLTLIPKEPGRLYPLPSVFTCTLRSGPPSPRMVPVPCCCSPTKPAGAFQPAGRN